MERVGSSVERRQMVRVVDDRTGRQWSAAVDAHAIVQVPQGREAAPLLQSLGLRPVEALMPSAGLWRVTDEGGFDDGVDLAERLRSAVESGQLVQATPDFWLEREVSNFEIPPNDPRYSGQWYLDQINIEAAWGISTGDPSTTVIVIDNGCDLDHPDLMPNMDTGLDVLDDDDVADIEPNVAGNEHGTACAGIIAARGHNNVGISGVCPECRVRCVRLLGRPNPVSADVRALRFALEVGAAVVSNSWSYGGRPAPAAVATAIAQVQAEGRNGLGTLFVFAAGNENRDIIPGEVAALPGVLTVGALNNFDEATAFSNRGEFMDLTVAAGTFTTDVAGADGSDPGDYTSRFGGTSAACPVVAGVAALLASADPTATAQEIRDALISTTRPAPFARPDADGHDIRYGFGIVQPQEALQALVGAAPPMDAGVPDMGVAADAGGSMSSEETSGCGVHGSGTTGAGPWLVAVGLFILRGSRRRRLRGANHA
ncbi:MAG: S8 family serine peptidase [Myxococcota bacterium]